MTLNAELPTPGLPVLKMITVVGARPQFIKAAMVSRAIQRHNLNGEHRGIEEIIVHTGQHFQNNMSAAIFAEMHIPEPKYFLNIHSLPHGAMTGRMLEGIERVLIDEAPDLVLVYGDTNSTLAGALAAAKLKIPVAHVEAGLRSHNRQMPEEINRILTDHLSTLLFCPTQTAVENLGKEGMDTLIDFEKNPDADMPNVDHYRSPFISDDDQRYQISGSDKKKGLRSPMIALVGDVMYDAVLCFGKAARKKSAILERLSIQSKTYVLVTLHRPENTDDPERLAAILNGLEKLSQTTTVIFPVHPRTRNHLLKQVPNMPQGRNLILLNKNLRLLDPLPFMDMLRLEQNARVILTDSGGVQKEAYFHSVPCVTLRDETEWVETVEAGWNQLAGADPEKIVFLTLNAGPGRPIDAYGEGIASDRIVKLLSVSMATGTCRHLEA